MSHADKAIQGYLADAASSILDFIGEDHNRPGLLETPQRFAKAMIAYTAGYDMAPEDVLKTFEDGAEGYDEMVAVVDIPFYSLCEHHMAPFFGTATIAYIPNGRVLGLSKLARLLDVYAKRLQVQERLTCQVADALMNYLTPKGAACKITARHMCMEMRGICKAGSSTVTTALRGAIKDQPETRAEFLALRA